MWAPCGVRDTAGAAFTYLRALLFFIVLFIMIHVFIDVRAFLAFFYTSDTSMIDTSAVQERNRPRA